MGSNPASGSQAYSDPHPSAAERPGKLTYAAQTNSELMGVKLTLQPRGLTAPTGEESWHGMPGTRWLPVTTTLAHTTTHLSEEDEQMLAVNFLVCSCWVPYKYAN